MIHYSNFDKVQTQEQGTGVRSLPAGGYVAQIVGAVLTETRNTHEPMIEIRLEIAEGEYKGIFQSKVQTPGTWPFNGTYRLSLPADPNASADDWRLQRFKGIISAVSESNKGFRWADDERALRGRFVGVLFRDEEFIGQQDGQPHTSSKPFVFCSVDRIRRGDFQVPKPKRLQENAQAKPQTYTSVPQDAGFGDFVPVETAINGDKDLPF